MTKVYYQPYIDELQQRIKELEAENEKLVLEYDEMLDFQTAERDKLKQAIDEAIKKIKNAIIEIHQKDNHYKGIDSLDKLWKDLQQATKDSK
jgi:hypothetical protein